MAAIITIETHHLSISFVLPTFSQDVCNEVGTIVAPWLPASITGDAVWEEEEMLLTLKGGALLPV